MKNTYLKPAPLIITAVGIAVLVVALVTASHHKAPFVPSHPVSTVPASGLPQAADTTPSAADGASVCYILNKPTNGGGKDIAYLKLTSTDGTNATGEFGTALDGKDALHGTIIGTMTADSNGVVTLDGQYSANGEGMNSVVEQKIQLTQSQAQIGYGELAQNSKGIYAYKDPSAVTYSLSLPSVSCAQYDTLKAATGTK